MEVIGVDGAVLDDNFMDANSLAIHFAEAANGNFSEFCIPSLVPGTKNYYEFNSVPLDYNDSYITAKLEGIYENGAVFEIRCHVDEASNKYNNATVGLLVVRNNQEPCLIITKIDGRVEENKKITGNKSSHLISVNQDKVNEIYKTLGGNLIEQGYVGERKSPNMFNKKSLEQMLKLNNYKVVLLVTKALSKLPKKENTKQVGI